MANHLKTKFAEKLTQAARRESVVANRFTNEYNFTGAKTLEVMSIVTQPMNDYQRSGTNRYGNPQELQDTVQELTVTQDKSFAVTVDRGNNEDQGRIKSAVKQLIRAQLAERAVPLQDQYSLAKLVYGAGKIVSGAALTKDNVMERITAGTTALDDAEIPENGRTLWVTSSVYGLIKRAPELEKVENVAEKALTKGIVGKIDNMIVVKVPASRMPTGVNFIIGHRMSGTMPSKIADTKTHKDPPGLSGVLIEGRYYYDAFVIGVRAGGIYADVSGTVLAAPTINATTGALSGVTGATYHYTTDGSDPRYSKTAVTGAAPVLETGVATLIKAYATKEGSFPSPVAELTVTKASA